MNPAIIVDLVFLAFVAVAAVIGFRKGFLFSILGVLALLFSLLVGFLLYSSLSNFLWGLLGRFNWPLSHITLNFLSFLLIFTPIFWFTGKISHKMTQQLFAFALFFLAAHRGADRVLGALLSSVLGVVLTSLAL